MQYIMRFVMLGIGTVLIAGDNWLLSIGICTISYTLLDAIDDIPKKVIVEYKQAVIDALPENVEQRRRQAADEQEIRARSKEQSKQDWKVIGWIVALFMFVMITLVMLERARVI